MLPVIFIEPAGGICNRMRALISACMLAEDTGFTLLVLWRLDHHLNCRFEELFHKPNQVKAILHIGDNRRYELLNALICRLFKRRLEQPDIEAMNRECVEYPVSLKDGSVFIRTYSRFHRDCDYTILRPQTTHLNRVADYALDERRVVGVHIRRTDHNVAINNSPTALFVDAMQRELDREPETCFFLATDSPEEEEILRGHFPDRIITHNKVSLDRNDPAGIKDALVDLYCLSRCRKLIGSYWSSFTDTAAAMGGIDLEVVKKAD